MTSSAESRKLLKTHKLLLFSFKLSTSNLCEVNKYLEI